MFALRWWESCWEPSKLIDSLSAFAVGRVIDPSIISFASTLHTDWDKGGGDDDGDDCGDDDSDGRGGSDGDDDGDVHGGRDGDGDDTGDDGDDGKGFCLISSKLRLNLPLSSSRR